MEEAMNSQNARGWNVLWRTVGWRGFEKNADRNVREPEVCREVCGNGGGEDARRSSLPDAVSAWAAVPPRVVLVLLVLLRILTTACTCCQVSRTA